MSLIENLHGRNLTGCRGCDAVRNALYKGLDAFSSEKQRKRIYRNGRWYTRVGIGTNAVYQAGLGAADASTLGAFIESPLGARGPEAALDPDLIELESFRVVTTFEIHSDHFGDKTASFTGSEVDAYDLTDTKINSAKMTINANVFLGASSTFHCGTVSTPSGRSIVNWTSGVTTTSPPVSISRVELFDSGGSLVTTWDNLNQCDQGANNRKYRQCLTSASKVICFARCSLKGTAFAQLSCQNETRPRSQVQVLTFPQITAAQARGAVLTGTVSGDSVDVSTYTNNSCGNGSGFEQWVNDSSYDLDNWVDFPNMGGVKTEFPTGASSDLAVWKIMFASGGSSLFDLNTEPIEVFV